MLTKILKKIFFRFKKSGESNSAIGQKIAKTKNFLNETVSLAKNEFENIKEKSKDLRATNYNLGLKHLEKGNVSEAIFRFRLVKKFYPDCFDAYYQLAYSLVLKKKLSQAKEVLEELLKKNPGYDEKAQELLQRLNSVI